MSGNCMAEENERREIQKWLKQIKDELNQAQFEFATSTENALLGLAGPGSGKTRALVYRAAHLLKTGVKPEELLLLTFTNKAAGEMKDRLASLLGYLPPYLWAGTFHSTGARVLRNYAHLLGRNSSFTIMDDEDSKTMLKQILSTIVTDDEERKIILKRGLLGRIISQSRNADQSIREVLEEDYPYRLEYLDVITRTAEEYEIKKCSSNAFDFDDLLLCWLEIFEEHPEVRDQYRRRFKHVLVDEFQDTNVIQARIIDLFANSASVCVVGDDAQSIYAFRYAHIGNILSFPEKYPRCHFVRMEKNYRSTPEIVKLANCTISKNREQLPKKLYSDNPSGLKPIVAKVYDARQEATFILQNIWELQQKGIPLDELAVLYRSSYLTAEVEFALARKGINYRTYGGLKFFQKAHIKDLLSYLKVIHNPRDENSWRRISTLQSGLGPASFDKMWERLKESQNPLTKALEGDITPARGKQGWTSLLETLTTVKEIETGMVPAQIATILESNYDAILRRNYPDQYEERISGVERLAIYAERFETLDTFLESLALEESVFADTTTMQTHGGQLTLSTIHSAKGKEWDAVFIIGMNQGHFPGGQVATHDLDEERRLFYVAATRARHYLFMTTYREDYRNYGAVSEGPSLFLRELPHDCYELIDLDDGY